MNHFFEKLVVWQKAHQLVLHVYKITNGFPVEEKYSLIDDMRRAARSVPTNLVEGCTRTGYRDALCFFNRSEASLAELLYHLRLSFDLSFIDRPIYQILVDKADEVMRLLKAWKSTYDQKNLQRSLRSKGLQV